MTGHKLFRISFSLDFFPLYTIRFPSSIPFSACLAHPLLNLILLTDFCHFLTSRPQNKDVWKATCAFSRPSRLIHLILCREVFWWKVGRPFRVLLGRKYIYLLRSVLVYISFPLRVHLALRFPFSFFFINHYSQYDSLYFFSFSPCPCICRFVSPNIFLFIFFFLFWIITAPYNFFFFLSPPFSFFPDFDSPVFPQLDHNFG